MQTAVGTRDLDGQTLMFHEQIRQLGDRIYSRYGSVLLETPIIENSSIVQSLYGEGFDKEVFWVGTDKEHFMRYDLTLPAARYVGTHGLKLFRRHQSGPVFRRDTPNPSRGRYRQFYQMDFDIYGDDNGTGLYDAEILSAGMDLMNRLPVKFRIRLNYKAWIIQLLQLSGVEDEMVGPVCSTLDKLDKKTVAEIQEELVEVRKLSFDTVESIMVMIDTFVTSEPTIEQTLVELQKREIDTTPMEKLLDRVYIGFGNDRVGVTVSPLLARGLDYYTGLIYELDSDGITFASGGRYDDMVEKFGNYGKVPAIGFSVGIDRLARLLIETGTTLSGLMKAVADVPPVTTRVLVAGVGKWGRYNSLDERIRLMRQLRSAPFNCWTMYNLKPRMRRQLEHCFDNDVPFMVIVGETEVETGKFNLKHIPTKVQIKEIGLEQIKEQITLLCQSSDDS